MAKKTSKTKKRGVSKKPVKRVTAKAKMVLTFENLESLVDGQRQWKEVDGKKDNGDYRKVGESILANGNIYYPAVTQDGKELVKVFKGRAGKKYDGIISFMGISEIGKKHMPNRRLHTELDHLVYLAQIDDKQILVVDGKERKRYDEVRKDIHTWKDDFLYVARENGEEFVVKGTEEGRRYKHVKLLDALGDDLIYVGVKEETGKEVVNINGEESKEYRLILTKDSMWLNFEGWSVNRSSFKKLDNKVIFVGMNENKKQVVNFGGEEGSEYDKVTHLFKLENGKLAYIAENGNRMFVNYDGNDIGPYRNIDRESLQLIDGKLAFKAAIEDWKTVLCFDGQDGPAVKNIESKIVNFCGNPAYEASMGLFSLKCRVVVGNEVTDYKSLEDISEMKK